MTKPWFIRKVRRFGVRLTPNAWQGWALLLGFVALTTGVSMLASRWFMEHMPQALAMVSMFALIAALIGGFILVAWRNSAPPDSIDRN